MSASSSIAAAKRRRGGAPTPTPQSTPRPGSSPNVLTPQQRALLLQQQQLMAQKSQTTYNPNVVQEQQPQNRSLDVNNLQSTMQVVNAPNGMTVPLGPDGKPLHPGVLIMNHEKRISELERRHANENNEVNMYDRNSINFVIEEGESAPWEEDIGMLNLKLDDLNKRVLFLEQNKQSAVSFPTVVDTTLSSNLQEKVDNLEKQLTTTKALLLKVQSFAMETNTMLLRYSNFFEQQQQVNSNIDTTSLKIVNDSNEEDVKAWIEAGVLCEENLNKLEDLRAELDKEELEETNVEELASE